jgi:hypothetical protein
VASSSLQVVIVPCTMVITAMDNGELGRSKPSAGNNCAAFAPRLTVRLCVEVQAALVCVGYGYTSHRMPTPSRAATMLGIHQQATIK